MTTLAHSLPGPPSLSAARPGPLPEGRYHLAPPVFAGRARELAALAALAAEGSAGQPGIALIQGAAGLGKSALVAEFLARHPELPELAASGDPAERELSWGLIRQLSSQADGALLARLPLLASGPLPAADPLRVGGELLELLTAQAAATGLAVVVEDVQWADLPAARALLYAVRRLAGHRVLAVLSARPDGLAHLGESWTRFLLTGRNCARMTLAGLDLAELTQLAAGLGRGRLSGQALRRVADYSRGNPLLAGALLAELPDRVLDGPQAHLHLPASVTSVILARLAALPAGARNLVSAASVLGGSCPVPVVAALAGVARPGQALDDAVAAGFLVLGLDSQEVRFADELTRRAVYADIAAARRRSLHRWAASITSGPAALAHRVAAACGPDPQLAAQLDSAAAAAAASGQVGVAASQLRHAAELGGGGPERADRLLSALELFVGAADPAAAEPLRPKVEQLPPSVRRDAALGHLAMLRGRSSEAQARWEAAWSAAQPAAGAQAAGAQAAGAQAALAQAALAQAALAQAALAQAALAQAAGAAAGLAMHYGSAGLLTECRVWTARSARAAAGPAGLAAAVTCWQALARALGGDPARALAAFAGLPDPAALVPAAQADELTVRGVLRLWTGDLPGADDDLTAACGLLEAGTRLRFPGHAAGYLAETEFRLGRWDDAQAHADLAIGLAEESGRRSDLPLARSLAAQIAAVRGDWELACAQAAAAEQEARRSGTPAAAALAGSARSLLGFARDDPAEVLQGTARLMAMAGACGPDDPAATWWQPVRIWALLRSGRPDEAAAALAACRARARQRGDQLTLVHCARLAAAAALDRDDVPAAEQALDQASALAGRLPMALARALFELERARCLARGRHRPAAQAQLRSVHRALVELRATPLAQAAQAELAALGLRDQPAADGSFPGLSGLSAQEFQVARLVAAGLSNRQAAARLYLSPKTVEYHLARIFAKLGVRSRYQLAARLRPPGLERESSRTPVPAGDQSGERRDGDLGGRV